KKTWHATCSKPEHAARWSPRPRSQGAFAMLSSVAVQFGSSSKSNGRKSGHTAAIATLGASQDRFETEAALLAGLLNDEPAAWREFNTRYSRLIMSCITKVTARFSSVVRSEDVREIYATLCVQLLANDKHKLRTFEPDRGSKLGTWLGMLANHTAYDFLRSAR